MTLKDPYILRYKCKKSVLKKQTDWKSSRCDEFDPPRISIKLFKRVDANGILKIAAYEKLRKRTMDSFLFKFVLK